MYSHAAFLKIQYGVRTAVRRSHWTLILAMNP